MSGSPTAKRPLALRDCRDYKVTPLHPIRQAVTNNATIAIGGRRVSRDRRRRSVYASGVDSESTALSNGRYQRLRCTAGVGPF
jgi:hypothetical protein